MTTSWGSWILGFGVLLLIFLSGYIMRNSMLLLITGKRAQGIVVEIYKSTRITDGPEKTPMMTPMVEFTTTKGNKIRVRGRSYSLTPTSQIGDAIKVAYSKSNPENAQLFLWNEFPLGPAGMLLGFAVLLVLIWTAAILISGDSSMDDPLRLLPALIAHFHLNPVRFPMLFMLALVIPVSILGTWLTTHRAVNLLHNGIRTTGYVTGAERVYSRSNDGSTGSGVFPTITFKDASGISYYIHGSTIKALSRLKTGDQVEVIYLANDPKNGVVNTWSEFWIPPLFFGFVMVALLFLLFLVLSGYKDLVT